ncbi:hypothetical protein IWQ49_006419 [Labrenzia sp. EL_126]|nr:hypothetical protein [Labrenzia sp. EL_126]
MLHTTDFVSAAKLPRHLLPWKSQDQMTNAMLHEGDAFLFDVCISGLHLVNGEGYGGYTIMDDSDREIRRHMSAVFAARGRVLKTGLGFGCFVRACLRNTEVAHIDVVEIDKDIIDHFGAEFSENDRVTIHHADAFEFPLEGRRWNLAWHDIYCEGNDGLPLLHLKLLKRYRRHADLQGAWKFPRWAARTWFQKTGKSLVGSPRNRVRKVA